MSQSTPRRGGRPPGRANSDRRPAVLVRLDSIASQQLDALVTADGPVPPHRLQRVRRAYLERLVADRLSWLYAVRTAMAVPTPSTPAADAPLVLIDDGEGPIPLPPAVAVEHAATIS